MQGVHAAGVDVLQILGNHVLQAVVLGAGAAAEVEALQPLRAVLIALSNGIELVLHRGGEVIVHQRAEVLLQQADDSEGHPAGDQRVAAGQDVTTVLNGADDRRVGRRAPDAELLHLPHEAGLGVTGRRGRRVTVRGDLIRGEEHALGDLREALLRIVGDVLTFCGAGDLDVGLQEAREGDGAAGGGELHLGARLRLARGTRDGDLHGGAAGVGHLGGDGALPDQLVELKLLGIQLLCKLARGLETLASGADRLVGFLGVLHLAGVLARAVRDELLAVQLGSLRTGGVDAGGGQRRGVRTHIGDVAVFVQALRDTHRPLRGEAQLPAGLLLQGGGHKRWVRAAGVGLFLHVCDVQFLALNSGRQLLRALFVQDQRGAGLAGLECCVVLKVAALCDALAVHGGELGLEGRRIAVQPGGGVDRELGGQIPVVRGAESHALALALDNHAGGDGLHTPCGQARHDLLPQHRGDLVAVQAVEHTAGLLGVHEVVIQLAGIFHGLEDRGLGDLVEDHAADWDLGLQDLQ